MRWGVLGLLLLVALIAAAVVGLLAAPITLQELRDIVIVVFATMSTMLLAALIVAALGLWFAVRTLSRTLTALLEDPVRPALNEMRDAARNVRGTSEFLADSTVHPLIRALSVLRGVRRGLGLVSGLTRRRR